MKLQRIAQQAKDYPAMVFNNVFHLIDREFLREAYHQTHKSSAPGMDQVTAQQYAEHLDENLRAAMGRLRLNDASFSYEMETSAALGFGFRVGFLGLLHLEIIRERLEREFNLDLIATAPNVVYRVVMENREEHIVKWAMMKRAERVVALVDSSKFGNVQMFGFASFEEIDVLITDTDVDPDALDILSAHGITVHRA